MIADDFPAIRRGVVAVISQQPDIEVVAQADNAGDVAAAVERERPHVLFLDLGMPGMRGLDLVSELRDEHPALGVIIYSMHREEDVALMCLKAGASGFVHKTASEEELVHAVRAAASGRRYLSPALAEQLLSDAPIPDPGPRHRALSARELRILGMVASGKKPNEIAAELGISIKTVHTYRARIMRKLGVRTTVELVLYSMEHRLLGWSTVEDGASEAQPTIAVARPGRKESA